MKSAVKNSLIILLCSALFACGNPKKTEIPTTGALENKEFQESMKKIEQSDRELVAKWIMRKVFQGGIPAGSTIESAIADQKQWQAEQDAAAAKEAEARAKLASLITWKTLDLKFIPQDLNQNRFTEQAGIKVEVTNNTEKTVTGVAGVMKFVNAFGTELLNIGVEQEVSIAPHQSTTLDLVGGQFEKKLLDALKNGDKVTVMYATDTILYSDGSKDGK